MCILLGVFHEFPVDPYYEPLAWFMIIMILEIVIVQKLLHYLSSPTSILVVLGSKVAICSMMYIKNFLTVGFPHCLSQTTLYSDMEG